MAESTRKHNEYDLVKNATGAVTGSDLSNDGYRGVIVFLDVTTNGQNVTVTVQGRSPTGKYYDIAVSAAEAGTGLSDPIRIYPGIAETANIAVDDLLPPRWRINVAVGTGSYDYDVAYAYIP